MKTIKYLGRHEAIVLEDDIEIDRAFGRNRIIEMRLRHGLDSTSKKNKNNENDN